MSNARAQTDWVLAVVCPQVGLVLGYGRAKRYSIPPRIVSPVGGAHQMAAVQAATESTGTA